MKTKITQKLLNEYHEVQQPETIFIRDATLQGFAIRVTKNGTIAFITEGRIKDGKNKRITIGKYPVFSIQDAKAKATQHLQLMRQGIDPEAEQFVAVKVEADLVACRQAHGLRCNEAFVPHLGPEEGDVAAIGGPNRALVHHRAGGGVLGEAVVSV